jgi:hypothetical protein
MTRSLRDWISPRSDGGAELDALLAGAWEDGTAAVTRVLDIEAGKAALLAAFQGRRSARQPGHQESAEDGAVAAVCGEVDILLAIITVEDQPNMGPAHSTVMPYLLSVRKFLIQLRAGLSRRGLTKAEALQLVGNVRHGLSEGARTLRLLPPGAIPAGGQEAAQLAELIASILHRLPALNDRIERLFDEAGDTSRVPVPQ